MEIIILKKPILWVVFISLLSGALMIGPKSTYAAIDDYDAYGGVNGLLSEGRLYAPLRSMAMNYQFRYDEQLDTYFDVKITWNQKTKTASLTKGGKTFNATVGNGVLLKNGSVYVQFKALSNFFYPNDYIKWDKSTLTGNSEHITVYARPLTDNQALTLATNAMSKKKYWIQFHKNNVEIGLPESEYIQWNKSLTKFKAVFHSDGIVGDYNYSYSIEAEMTKKANNWTITSFNYSDGTRIYYP
ncbi:copper amine oxidase N-terminal domain-containing protein [Paenibacillus sp. p3-SID867]|uniref:copper amine oxidase N-terminal domain-containing protein n=1 Tax=Paenibacillus sp. p3-SID867 TaxID=2916363 RepID=UPI0021A3A5DA|nr:copper amine oxidase N-terminal domain-containing protein [Paenibacillus sp. p3-SID867]MCT1402850.1 copper amine oxidase N-terminal domain-containing protein [Paenibacillus sp. p3-SID867]